MTDASPNETPFTGRRKELDPLFKGVLGFRFGQLNIPLQTQVEVSHLPRTMDALAILKRKADRDVVRAETPFHYFCVYNQVEFKGENDPLTLAGYRLILGRANLYMGENQISASEMTITIVCAGKPRQVLFHSQSEVEFQSLGGGYYRSTDKLPVYVIVINELDITPYSPKRLPHGGVSGSMKLSVIDVHVVKAKVSRVFARCD